MGNPASLLYVPDREHNWLVLISTQPFRGGSGGALSSI